MTDLSPAAQAVWDAFNEDEPGVFIDYGDCLAAALRAAAKTFDRPNRSDAHELWNEGFQFAQGLYRRELENIAAELEGAND